MKYVLCEWKMDFDALLLRFDHIAMAIFEQLDGESLIRSQRVCRSWYTYLNRNQSWRNYWTKKLVEVVSATVSRQLYYPEKKIRKFCLIDQFETMKHIYDYYIGTDLSKFEQEKET